MDTFDTSEEVMSEIDIEATEVDFGENFEHGVNNQERENNNEQEAGIGGETGEKGIEDEKLEEKEETLSQFISANRGGSEEFKLEYEGTFVLSTLNEEQKTAQADLLTTLTANPEQSMMLPDYREGKTTYFTAAKMDNEGNLKYEIRSFTEKEEEKETLLGQSLSAEIEAVNQERVEEAEEIIQAGEQNFTTSEVHYADVEQVISVEETQSEVVSSDENVSIDNTHYVEQLAVDAKEDAEKVITERIIDLFKEEPQLEFVEETNTVISVVETEQTFKDTQERTEPLVVTVEDKTEKVQTLEDRIIELLRDEDEPIEVAFEQVQTSEFENTQQEQVVVNMSEITEKSGVREEIKAEEGVVEKVQSSDVVVEAVADIPEAISRTETVLSEVVDEKHVAEDKSVKSESNVVQEMVVNNIQTQSVEKIETVPYDVTDNDKNETQNVRSINIENIKEEKTEQNKESIVNVIKGEEKIVVETKIKDINPITEKVDNTRSEKITTERIITERRIQDKQEKPEVILNNEKDIKVASTRENTVVAKEATTEKVQVPNIKTEKEVRNNVLPFKTKESKPNLKSVEVKAIKPVVEKTNTTKEMSRLPNADREKTTKNSREAIVLSFNRNTINNTTRSEALISLEKPREEKRTTEESLKAKLIDGHEILLQILGISKNTTESRNAEPTNSRLIPNINQEEQETKSTKSIPSIYQQRNLNGITLKIAA